MADKHFFDLPVATPLNGAELVPGDQGGATVQMTAQQIANLAPVQDHNTLTSLTAGDAHPQYLNVVRGDARYPLQTRAITTGNGLTGGGDLAADRALNLVATPAHGITITVSGIEVDVVGLGVLPEAVDSANDKLLIYNQSEGRPRFVSPSNALAGASGFVVSSRLIASGAGLIGGGDLSADRTLAVGAGTGITVNADDVALDTANTRNVDHAAVTMSAGTGLIGGGTLAANRSFSLDNLNSRNVDHAAVTISGGLGVTGGGDLTANRQVAIDTAVVPQLGSANIFANAFNSFGRSGTVGFVALQGGSATIPGFVGFWTVDGISRGSVGASSTPGTLAIKGTAGWVWDLFTNSGATVPWSVITGTKNADQLLGAIPSVPYSPSSIVQRDTNGYVFGNYFNGNEVNGDGATISQFYIHNGVDGYHRRASVAQVQTALGVSGSVSSNGTFAVTLSDTAGPVSGTLSWRKVGSKATISCSGGLAGTSTGNTLGFFGLPAALIPVVNVRIPCTLNDNSLIIAGSVFINTAGSVSFAAANGNSTGFTIGGIKGFPTGFQLNFDLGT
jgi:hypothetical protein